MCGRAVHGMFRLSCLEALFGDVADSTFPFGKQNRTRFCSNKHVYIRTKMWTTYSVCAGRRADLRSRAVLIDAARQDARGGGGYLLAPY